jgi:hypothetical protein
MSCYVLLFNKDGKKFYDSRPLVGVETDDEAKKRAEAIYKLQSQGVALKLGEVQTVHKYLLGNECKNQRLDEVVENGFGAVPNVINYRAWKDQQSQLGGGKKTTKKASTKQPATKKPVAKKPAAKKVVKKTK